MKLPQTGGCQCGKIRYEITEGPQSVYTCHCLDCQRLTSSAFSLEIVVPEKGLRLTGLEPRRLQRTADSGRANIRLVCPECGLGFAHAEGWCCPRPGRHARRYILAVRPTRHIWARRKQPWVQLPEGDEVFEGQSA
jgi:hypothetical protein